MQRGTYEMLALGGMKNAQIDLKNTIPKGFTLGLKTALHNVPLAPLDGALRALDIFLMDRNVRAFTRYTPSHREQDRSRRHMFVEPEESLVSSTKDKHPGNLKGNLEEDASRRVRGRGDTRHGAWTGTGRAAARQRPRWDIFGRSHIPAADVSGESKTAFAWRIVLEKKARKSRILPERAGQLVDGPPPLVMAGCGEVPGGPQPRMSQVHCPRDLGRLQTAVHVRGGKRVGGRCRWAGAEWAPASGTTGVCAEGANTKFRGAAAGRCCSRP
ncbi:hypothetical protein K474DRAFT_1765733 [Panus rudis PR-1116 ss-1]|nr:hypothetical protein K474DRAFT_1765733 [Panus rudis PR-1116 ss-1]